jgi:hypothetical protein
MNDANAAKDLDPSQFKTIKDAVRYVRKVRRQRTLARRARTRFTHADRVAVVDRFRSSDRTMYNRFADGHIERVVPKPNRGGDKFD